MNIIEQLGSILKDRTTAAADESYVASLYAAGLNHILEKLSEEATETLLAAKDADSSKRDQALIAEVADLWFHSLVMLVHLNQEPAWVMQELERRFGTSGLVEKSSRGGSSS